MRRSAVVACILGLCCITPASAQSYAVSPRLAFGGTSDRLVPMIAVEARLEAPLRTLAPYLSLGVVSIEQNCETSQPPRCSVPSAAALGLDIGGTLDGSVSHGVPLYASLGTGARIWHGWDYHLTAELGLRLRLPGILGLDLGLRGTRLWISERTCADFLTCPVTSREKVLDTGAIVVGIRILGGF